MDSGEFREKFQKFISQSELHISKDEYLSLYDVFLKDLTPSKEPFLTIFAGGPGAGKTTARRKYIKNCSNFHLHDLDEIMIILQSYQKDLKELGNREAFENNWQISRNVANQLAQFAFQNKFNVVYDRSCGAEGSLKDLQAAISDGYLAEMNAFYVDEETALQRIAAREKTEGRFVSCEIAREYTQKFSILFDKYLSFIPNVNLFCHGELCFEKKGEEKTIFTKGAYENFVNYGKA